MSVALVGTVVSSLAATPIQRSTVSTTAPKAWEHKVPAFLSPRQAAPVVHAPLRAPEAPYSLPFTMAPTKEQFDNECTVIDANGDTDATGSPVYNRWIFWDAFGFPVYWAQSPKGVADDWLIFPAISFPDADKIYKLSIDAAASNTGAMESMEVRIGTSPTVEAMSQVVMSEPVVEWYANDQLKTFSETFAIPEAGTYYVAIRCTSNPATAWRLRAKNLKVEATAENALYPVKIDDLTAAADEQDNLKMNVTFTLPTKAVNGSNLPADKDLTAVVSTSSDSRTVTGKPGDKKTVKLQGRSGVNNVSVEVITANGESSVTTTTVQCGEDYPKAPVVKSTVSDDNYSMRLEWEPVTEGESGGNIFPQNIVYDVVIYNEESESWVYMEEGLTDCFFEASVPPGTALGYVDLGVVSRNSRGMCEQATNVSELLGTPYTLPLDETLEGSQYHYTGLDIHKPTAEYDAVFGAGNPGDLNSQFANSKGAALMAYKGSNSVSRGRIVLPKFSTVGVPNVQIILPIYLFNNAPEMTVYAKTNSGEEVTVATVDLNAYSGWGSLVYDLPAELLDKQCVSVGIDMKFTNANQLFIMEGYTVKVGAEKDMAVTDISVLPTVIVPGEKTTITATVMNNGKNSVAVPTLKGTVTNIRGKQIGTFEFVPESTEALEMRKSVNYVGEYTMMTSEYIGAAVRFVASLTEADEDASNDLLSIQAEVGTVEQPVINDLTGSFNEADGSIALQWTSPIADEALETFEFLPTFSYDSKLGRWTNLDYDNAVPYTLGELENVCVLFDDQPKAFQVISAHESHLDEYGVMGYDNSDKMLIAMSPQNATADDWLISPQVEADSEVAFMWANISSEFPETIELWYSSTDADVDSFKLLKKETSDDQNWHEFMATLPADARYFAIHYCSTDAFGVMIDDIIYFPTQGAYTLNGYELLRDGEHLADLPADATSYVDNTVELGKNYVYHLVPEFISEEGTRPGLYSNSCSMVAAGVEGIVAGASDIYAVKGAIVINGHEGETLPLYNAQGQLLRNITPAAASHTEAVAPGFYIVGNAKVIVK